MTDTNDTPQSQPDERLAAVAAVSTGSASEIIIAELTGLPIRLLNRQRMFRTGDRICNRFGQELWTVEAFHPRGVMLREWPMGNLVKYTWEAFYQFYDRVTHDDPSLQNIGSETRRKGESQQDGR